LGIRRLGSDQGSPLQATVLPASHRYSTPSGHYTLARENHLKRLSTGILAAIIAMIDKLVLNNAAYAADGRPPIRSAQPLLVCDVVDCYRHHDRRWLIANRTLAAVFEDPDHVPVLPLGIRPSA